uniref:Uncharacterized protein n=1 Tax=Branchiostoma floridae TaxID=7739 RepID=C3Z2G2_BRAFL|eukprot:XP_002597201.1 hypothetical protein BRAFLDRAFT_66327 [Branchiostoma floridae]
MAAVGTRKAQSAGGPDGSAEVEPGRAAAGSEPRLGLKNLVKRLPIVRSFDVLSGGDRKNGKDKKGLSQQIEQLRTSGKASANSQKAGFQRMNAELEERASVDARVSSTEACASEVSLVVELRRAVSSLYDIQSTDAMSENTDRSSLATALDSRSVNADTVSILNEELQYVWSDWALQKSKSVPCRNDDLQYVWFEGAPQNDSETTSLDSFVTALSENMATAAWLVGFLGIAVLVTVTTAQNTTEASTGASDDANTTATADTAGDFQCYVCDGAAAGSSSGCGRTVNSSVQTAGCSGHCMTRRTGAVGAHVWTRSCEEECEETCLQAPPAETWFEDEEDSCYYWQDNDNSADNGNDEGDVDILADEGISLINNGIVHLCRVISD